MILECTFQVDANRLGNIGLIVKAMRNEVDLNDVEEAIMIPFQQKRDRLNRFKIDETRNELERTINAALERAQITLNTMYNDNKRAWDEFFDNTQWDRDATVMRFNVTHDVQTRTFDENLLKATTKLRAMHVRNRSYTNLISPNWTIKMQMTPEDALMQIIMIALAQLAVYPDIATTNAFNGAVTQILHTIKDKGTIGQTMLEDATESFNDIGKKAAARNRDGLLTMVDMRKPEREHIEAFLEKEGFSRNVASTIMDWHDKTASGIVV